jgi:hypothetical protein
MVFLLLGLVLLRAFYGLGYLRLMGKVRAFPLPVEAENGK